MPTKRQVGGSLTMKQRVEIAKDVVKLMDNSRIKISPMIYLSVDELTSDRDSEFNSAIFATSNSNCYLCARGALFLASVDKFNKCKVKEVRGRNDVLINRTKEEWGLDQISLIEGAFETWDRDHLGMDNVKSNEIRVKYPDHSDRLKFICRSIIKNRGVFIP